jgi:hypothetical protein
LEGVAMGKRKGRIIRARGFEVVDDDGNVRASFECDDIGAGIRLWFAGNCVATMAVSYDGSGYLWVGNRDADPIWQTLAGSADG